MTQTRAGVLAMLAACVLWGMAPLFFSTLSHVPPAEVMAHRVFWSMILFAGFLLWQGRLRSLRGAFESRGTTLRTVFSSLFVSSNWFLFIYAVFIGRTTEAALGYYIFPLVAVVLGVIIYGERLSRLQWGAVALAAAGVLWLTIGLGTAPVISLILAVTFGLYGMIKKGLTIGPVVSVTAEALVLVPPALGYLLWLAWQGTGAFGQELTTSLLLAASGIQTALPLILFSRAAQRIAYSTVGLIQYINPTLQFLCAVFILSEPFGTVQLTAFAMIWTALAIYTASGFAQDRARRKSAIASVAPDAGITKSSSEASAKP